MHFAQRFAPGSGALTRFVLASAIASLPALASETPAVGFRASGIANPVFGSASCTLEGGDLVTFDGTAVERWSETGLFVQHLGGLASFAYPSFLAPTPDGSAVVVGESGYGAYLGGLHLAPLDGSGLVSILPLALDYDAEFLPNGELIVSAATQGWGLGNDLVRVRLAPPSATWIGHVAGPSGPLAVASNGDVYYATVPDGFSPPTGQTSVLRWTYAQVLAGGPLDEASATLVGSGFDGGTSLALDPKKQKLYLADNHWSSGTHRIYRVKGNAAQSQVLVESSTNWLSGLRFRDLGGAAIFEPFQPSGGVVLAYASTDFFSVDEIVACEPARPTLTIGGPGATGIGQVDLTCSGGVPGGIAYLSYCPQSAISSSESAFRFPRFLHHTPFDLVQTERIPLVIQADAFGNASYSFFNDGSQQGLFGYQFFVGAASWNLFGSSNAASF